MRNIIAALALTMGLVGGANASDLTPVCEFGQSVVERDFDTAFSHLDKVMPNWGAEQRKGLKPVLDYVRQSAADSFEFYDLYNLNGLTREVLLVTRSTEKGPTYIRMYFEDVGGETQMLNINLQSSFRKIAFAPFPANPVALDCD